MIHFFGNENSKVFAVQTTGELSSENISKLTWLFGNQNKINTASLDAFFVGPRAAMITPWSTNAVEITQNMGVEGIIRIEQVTIGISSSNFNNKEEGIISINAIHHIPNFQAQGFGIRLLDNFDFKNAGRIHIGSFDGQSPEERTISGQGIQIRARVLGGQIPKFEKR